MLVDACKLPPEAMFNENVELAMSAMFSTFVTAKAEVKAMVPRRKTSGPVEHCRHTTLLVSVNREV